MLPLMFTTADQIGNGLGVSLCFNVLSGETGEVAANMEFVQCCSWP